VLKSWTDLWSPRKIKKIESAWSSLRDSNYPIHKQYHLKVGLLRWEGNEPYQDHIQVCVLSVCVIWKLKCRLTFRRLYIWNKKPSRPVPWTKSTLHFIVECHQSKLLNWVLLRPIFVGLPESWHAVTGWWSCTIKYIHVFVTRTQTLVQIDSVDGQICTLQASQYCPDSTSTHSFYRYNECYTNIAAEMSTALFSLFGKVAHANIHH